MTLEQTEISPLYALSLCTHLVSMYNNDTLSDVSVLCEDEVFELHSPVLSHASLYFRELLERGENDIVIDESLGIGTSEFRILAESMYTGNVRGLTLRNIGKVLKASHILQMNMAKNSCEQFMVDNMNIYNALEFWILGDLVENDYVTHEAIGLLGRHLEDVSKSKTYLNLDIEKVEKILMNDHLMVSNERSVYEAVLLWIRHDLPSRQREFNRLLNAVRMPFLSDQYLTQVLGKEDMILNNCAALKRYSEALKMKLNQVTCSIRSRHSFIHGFVGGIDRMLMILSPVPTQGWEYREKIKPFEVPSNLVAVGGVFAKCCAPEDNAQGEAPHLIGPFLNPIKKTIFDPVGNMFNKIPGHLEKATHSIKNGFVHVAEPVGKTFESVQKNIGSKVVIVVDSVKKGVSEDVPSVIKVVQNSVKNFVKHIREHDYDYSSKRQINGFWFDVQTQNASPDQLSKAKSQDSKIYDLSGLEEGGLVSSFSFDEPLEHISEMSEEDRESIHSEVHTDSQSKNLRVIDKDNRKSEGTSVIDYKQNVSKKIGKPRVDLFSDKSEDSSRESERLIFEESYSTHDEDNETEDGNVAVDSSNGSAINYSENASFSEECSRGSDKLIFEENYESSFLDGSDNQCEGNGDTFGKINNEQQSSSETSFSNSDSEEGLMVFS